MVSTEKIYVSPETKQKLYDERRLGEDYDATLNRLLEEVKLCRLKK